MRNKRKLIYSFLILLVAIVGIMSLIIFGSKKNSISVVFLDVGQGDSILISQGSQQILIDGGKDGKVLLEKLGKYIPFWDRKIEMIIETHPDADHIGGLVDVFKVYKVDSVIKTNMQSQSQTFKSLGEAIEKNNSDIIEALKGERINFANGAEMDVIFPIDTIISVDDKDTNAASVVIKLNFGVSSFLFTGDLPVAQEQAIVDSHVDIKSDILKVGHHGSKYSSSGEFLKAVKPIDAIISVGKNNTYGHPSQEALQRLLQQRVNILRTDEKGDVVYECKSANNKCQIKSF